MENKQMVELLAPVGSNEALKAAIQNGADAIYMGGKLFSARQYAQNFTNEELIEAVNYAHLYGARVYVAVNTLVDNSELPELMDYLYTLYSANVDAIIVQDIGVIKAIRHLIPDMEIHASTQMTIHNSAGVRFLEELGLGRVVLAREVSLNNIELIGEHSKLPLETFIHGALCVSYSGQCLMSSMIGGRSGNRGRCAQPCRLNYTLVNKKNEELQIGHLLSPRDLKMIEHLPLLVKAGIVSLKIEGRMKRSEYVATVIRNYRQALDHFYYLSKQGKTEDYAVSPQSHKDLAQIFNRDFTTGYFLEKPGPQLMSYQRPNNRGLMMGRVTAFDPLTREVTLELTESVRVGDGYDIWVTRGGRTAGEIKELIQNGRIVERVEQGKATFRINEGQPRVGDRVFKTLDAGLVELARHSYLTPQGIIKYPLEVKLKVQLNEPAQLTATDEQGRKVEVIGSFAAEKAQKHPLTQETVTKQLVRLGNTIFFLQKLELDMEPDLMVPVSELNNLRRDMVDRLVDLRLAPYLRKTVAQNKYTAKVAELVKSLSPNLYDKNNKAQQEVRLAVQVGDLASLRAAVKSGASIVYFGGESYRGQQGITPVQWDEVVSYCQSHRVEAVLIIPRLFHEEQADEIKNMLERSQRTGITAILAGNAGTIQLCREIGIQRIYGDYTLNVFNDLTIEQLQEKGLQRITLSPELNLEQLKKLHSRRGIDLECLIHGQFPLMITEQCTVGNVLGKGNLERGCPMPCKDRGFGLKDRLNMVFPIECDENCRMHVFNPKTLSLLDRLPDLLQVKIGVLRIDGRREDEHWVRKVVALYRQELDRFKEQGAGYRVNSEIKEELAKLSPAGLTAGHYYRGVL